MLLVTAQASIVAVAGSGPLVAFFGEPEKSLRRPSDLG
jgi:hypothetical protein